MDLGSMFCIRPIDIAVIFSASSGGQTQRAYGVTAPISMAGPKPVVCALRSLNWVLFL